MDSSQPGQPGQPGPSPASASASAPPPGLELLLNQPFSELAKVATTLPINWAELPPPPFFVPRGVTRSDLYRGSLAYTIVQMQWRAQRALTRDETQIVAVQKAKYLSTMAYAVPATLAITAAYTWRGRRGFRFPFYTPPAKTFKPDTFPTRLLPWLKGPHARIMWHSCRFAAYLAISQWAISSFFVSYALTVRQAEFDGDPRLNGLRSSIKQAATARMAHSKSPRLRKMAEQIEHQQQQQQDQDQSQSQVRTPTRLPGQDDPVPQDQAFESDQQLEDARYQKEQQQYQQEFQPQSQQRYPAQYQYQQPPARPARAAQSAQPAQPAQLPWMKKRDERYDDFDDGPDDFDDFSRGGIDDASPVTPAEQHRSKWQRSSSSSSSSTGSAWDRVRAQAAPKRQTAAATASSEGDVPPQGSKWSRVRSEASPDADRGGKTAGDYMYDLRDEEKSLAKEDAQKDFDAMLDRERRGENDADSRRKW